MSAMKKEPEWMPISGSRPISGSYASPSRSGAVAGP